MLGLTHREVERDLVVDVAGAAAAAQQRQQPTPPADRVMEALHGGHDHAPCITRVTAGPHPDNRRSCRAFEKAGFVAVRDVVVPESGRERIHVRTRS